MCDSHYYAIDASAPIHLDHHYRSHGKPCTQQYLHVSYVRVSNSTFIQQQYLYSTVPLSNSTFMCPKASCSSSFPLPLTTKTKLRGSRHRSSRPSSNGLSGHRRCIIHTNKTKRKNYCCIKIRKNTEKIKIIKYIYIHFLIKQLYQ